MADEKKTDDAADAKSKDDVAEPKANAHRDKFCNAKDPNNCRFHKTGRFAPYKVSASPSVLGPRIADVATIGNFTDKDGKKHSTRIMASTGKPCSGILNDTINRLLAGDPTVTDEDIERCPEWRMAQAHLDDFKIARKKNHEPQYTDSIDTPERDELREKIFERFTNPTITEEYNDAIDPKNGGDGKPYDVKRGKRIDIITGLPAAGKSHTFARRLSLEHQSRLVDSDEIKKQLPEYNDGIGADTVHEESTKINGRVLQEAARRGENIVYPILGFKAHKLEDLIDKMRKAGYQVHLHLNELEVQKAKGRMLLRFVEKNRFIPLCVYRKAGNLPSFAYEKVKEQCDGYDKYRSDTGTKAKPVLVEQGGKE